jgi:hypothetical protein
MFVVICFIVAATALLSWAWVRGINHMQENHPDYKGEDFLDWYEENISNSAGRDAWDDNSVHTEGDF